MIYISRNFIESIFTTDVIKISNIFACGSFILDHILVFSSIIVLSGLTLVFMSGGYVWKIIDGVGRWVPVVASGLYINDVLGNPLGVPGQGRQGGQGQTTQGQGSQGQGSQGQGSQGGNGTQGQGDQNQGKGK